MNYDYAFPSSGEDTGLNSESGLTKREYYAAIALQAIIATYGHDIVEASILDEAEREEYYSLEGEEKARFYAGITAKAAVIYANALVKELES